MNEDRKAKLLLENENYNDLDFIRACVELGGKEFAIQVVPMLKVSMMVFYYLEETKDDNNQSVQITMKSKCCKRKEFLDILMENKLKIVG